jgi:cytochrome c5
MRGLLPLLPLVLPGVWLTAAAGEEPKAKPSAVDYKRDVVPILEANCNRCHTAEKAGGKLVTTSRADMLKGGVSGPAVEPGRPDRSILIEVIHFNEMPPKREKPRVTADELKLLKDWITAGAPEK